MMKDVWGDNIHPDSILEKMREKLVREKESILCVHKGISPKKLSDIFFFPLFCVAETFCGCCIMQT